MVEVESITNSGGGSFGSSAIDKIVMRLQNTKDQKRKYEYLLWLAKTLPPMSKELMVDNKKVKGCISEVYVHAELSNGTIHWQGYSDALITKGLLAFLIEGLNELTPEQVIAIDPNFIKASGLQGSLTPSRANGFLNILLKMKAQAKELVMSESLTNS